MPGATYPNMRCSTELFTDPEMLEVRTLGPLTRLDPSTHLDHVETWPLAKVAGGEADGDEQLLPLEAVLRRSG